MNLSSTRIIYALCAIAFVVILIRAYGNVKGPEALQATLPQAEVEAFAKEQLNAVQSRSFSENIELCGIIFESADATLGMGRKTGGSEATCDLIYYDEPGMVPVASFHTHGSYGPQYDSEVPSIQDIQSDMASGIDGYVATPGGRFWHIDHETGTARLICGEGCLVQDPKYRSCAADRIEQRYTVQSLAQRSNAPDPAC
ncbi:DUF4329 domain-containing protein [Erythrobacter sp. SCSIO 43205]|uniref:DUF4329 domain-containing protein n=1 Tax=Erythrobacter sp. SCSIO 43205 TaxID=2779361 RepID=UPI001CA8223E|nr:DUF4329 domain-containing protein [Erythrobacter sp. SCSIO 43205]UAB77057.1 DUF4329 domain-containing protein [Erythrobacter sp. SCSIO 43205]